MRPHPDRAIAHNGHQATQLLRSSVVFPAVQGDARHGEGEEERREAHTDEPEIFVQQANRKEDKEEAIVGEVE